MASTGRITGLLGIVFCLFVFNVTYRMLVERYMNTKRSHSRGQQNNSSSFHQHPCPHHHYRTRIIERNPLIIYIEEFLTPFELQHLLRISRNQFERSQVFDQDGSPLTDQYRTSSSTTLKRRQTRIVECIERRISEFQGHIDLKTIEPLQMVEYFGDQQFEGHFDWFKSERLLENGGQRVTTFFTYVKANCSTGETEFLDIPFQESIHSRFCDILTCNENSSKHGLRFRPIPGNSIFWFNIDLQGRGDDLTYHAGLAPGKGCHKVGLNTWTRQHHFSTKHDDK